MGIAKITENTLDIFQKGGKTIELRILSILAAVVFSGWGGHAINYAN